MLDLFLAFLLGLLVGIVAGLIPGLHVNSTIPIILAIASNFNPLFGAIILIVAGVSQSFVGFIPSILLGAPESDTALSTLPGHKLMLQGRAYEAIKLTVIGGMGALLFSIALLPVIAPSIKFVYLAIRPHLSYLLSLAVAYMVLNEQGKKDKVYAAVVFTLSGLLGIIVLNGFGNEMLFPMLTGLFGIPLLINSVQSKVKLPESISFEETKMNRRDIATGIAIGSIGGILVGLLPGVGASQAAVIAQEATSKNKDADRQFLISIAGVNISDMAYSLLALWLLSNPRSGIAVAIGNLMSIGLREVLVFLVVLLAAAGISAALTLMLARSILPTMRRIHYRNFNITVLVTIFVLIGLFTGVQGLLISLVSTSIGLIAIFSGIKKSNAMGCLLLPTILFFL